jgi:hypothetical protein
MAAQKMAPADDGTSAEAGSFTSSVNVDDNKPIGTADQGTDGQAAATLEIRVTRFDSFAATKQTPIVGPLAQLRDGILGTTRATKSALPWLKLASFGNRKSDVGSLRHDDNVTGIDGIELDYDGKDGQDGKPVSFDDALADLNSVGVCGLLYTSPSHTKARPHWRVLMPTSQHLPNDMRAKLVARINGRLGNIFAPESFTLSQAYYYGRANDNLAADHRAEIVGGDYVDLRDDLYKYEAAGAKDKTSTKHKTSSGGDENQFEQHGEQYGSGGHGYEAYLAKMGDGPGLEGFNIPLCQASASYVAQHSADFDHETLKEMLRQAINDAPKAPDRKPSDIRRYCGNRYLNTLIKTAIKKYGTRSNDDYAAADNDEATANDAKEGPDDGSNTDKPKSALSINATPFLWIDPTKVPLREWLYRPCYIRQFLSLTISTGGVGKSSLLIAEALAMVSGKDLLNILSDEVLRVWYWNGEDPTDELQRRFAAAIVQFNLSTEDIGDRLFLDSGRNMPVVLATEARTGTVIATPVINDLIATLVDHKIDVLMIDPFVSCHRVSENDNTAIDRVAKAWSFIAEKANCSIMLAHHTRKTMGGGNVSVDDGRGASALLAAGRSARTLNNMTKEEADKAGIDPSQRTFHFRSDMGKANLTKPAEGADWFKLTSVDLKNNPAMPGMMSGDEVGVVTAWEYQADKASVTVADIKRAQDVIAAGGPWRRDQRAKERWIGIAMADAFGRDIDIRKNRTWVEQRIRLWLTAGLLRTERRPDPAVKSRAPVEFVVVGRAPEPGDGDVEF